MEIVAILTLIMEMIKVGKRNDSAELLNKHFWKVARSYVKRQVDGKCDNHALETACADATMTLLEKHRSIVGNPLSWFCVVTYRKYIDLHRQVSRYPPTDALAVEQAPSHTPYDAAECQKKVERRSTLVDAINQLSRLQREVMMATLDGCDDSDLALAKRLNSTQGSVRVSRCEGIRKLKTILAESSLAA